MRLSDKVLASSDVVAQSLGDETILLHLIKGTYFGLDPVGARIWELLDERPYSISDLCDVLMTEFQVTRAILENDILALADEMAAKSLISVQ